MSDRPRKQKPKSGHVLRISDFAWSLVESRRSEGQTTREAVDQVVCELIDLTTKLEELMRAPSYYVLPDALMKSEPEARGAAVLRAVRSGRKKIDEEPIAVRVI